MWGDSTKFLLNGNQEVFRLDAPEYVSAAVLSEDRKTLVLVLLRSTGFRSEFAALLRVQPHGNSVTIDRVLESGQKLFDGRWLFSELGAVSNDGGRILAKFFVGDAASQRMVSRWHTINLADRRILSEGLTITDQDTEPDLAPKAILVGAFGSLFVSIVAFLIWRRCSRKANLASAA
jgi:hypothetical protein